jgi:hypothetical protein
MEQPVKKKNMKIIGISLIILIVIIVAGIGVTILLTQNQSNWREMDDLYDLVNYDSETTTEHVRVYGTIRNTAGQNLEVIYVDVKFYDKDNTLFYTGETSVNNIADGDAVNFEVTLTTPYHIEKYDHFEIEVRIHGGIITDDGKTLFPPK